MYKLLKEKKIRRTIKNKEIRKEFKNYDMNHRDIPNNLKNNIGGPGSLYQINAIIADIHLVSRYDKQKIVGRPTLYFVIDTYSRIIAGVYVSYESPSWIGAMMALSNATSDKVKYCKEYEIDIEKDEWNIEGIPESITADIDEMEVTSVEPLINSLGIKILNTYSYTPYLKCIPERIFNIIKSEYKQFTLGYVKEYVTDGIGNDYRLDNALDIYEFTQIIIKAILKYNNYTCITKYGSHYKLIEDGIEPTPKNIWDHGLENKIGRLRFVDNTGIIK